MNRNRILALATKLMSNEGYGTYYLCDYIDGSIAAKAHLREILSHHPNWNEEMGWIHFSYDTERRIDMNILRAFRNWFRNKLGHINPDLTESEIISLHDFVDSLTICNDFGQYPTDEVVSKANELLQAKRRGHVTKETRCSKILLKIAKAYGLNAYSEIRNMDYWGQDGQFHKREKDMGWNYQFAQFADAINPIKVRRHTLISVNPVDYLTMSWGDSWESCHDTHNADDPGCYSAGTMSYGLDEVSIIFYYVDQKYGDDSDFCELPKQKRCVFCWGEGKLLQSRVYPDGRDGGDFGLAEETRSIVQKVMADCLDIPNLWDLVKGKEHIKTYAVSEGWQYADYTIYNDCTTSYPKAYGAHSTAKLRIGKYGFCPECGGRQDQEKNICCSCCTHEYDGFCLECGDGYYDDSDSTIYIEDVGTFCCEDCANRYGYYYVDDDWYREEDIYTDDYTGEEFADTSEMVETEEGGTYRNEHNAELDGAALCVDDHLWHSEGHYVIDGYTGWEYYDETQLNRIDGEWYTDESAEKMGYVMDENGNWKEEDEDEAVSEDSENAAAPAEEVAA